jgi:hypothetical protein
LIELELAEYGRRLPLHRALLMKSSVAMPRFDLLAAIATRTSSSAARTTASIRASLTEENAGARQDIVLTRPRIADNQIDLIARFPFRFGCLLGGAAGATIAIPTHAIVSPSVTASARTDHSPVESHLRHLMSATASADVAVALGTRGAGATSSRRWVTKG